MDNLSRHGLILRLVPRHPRKIDGADIESVVFEAWRQANTCAHISSHAHAFLENLTPSRAKNGEAEVLLREDIERKLAGLLRTKGEAALNAIRDEHRKIARDLGFEKERGFKL